MITSQSSWHKHNFVLKHVYTLFMETKACESEDIPHLLKLTQVDWKRVELELDVRAGASFHRFGRGPCRELVDNKFNHYAAQQNLYALILEDFYGINVETMSLVQIHPARGGYTVVPVPASPRWQEQCSRSQLPLGDATQTRIL